MRSIHEVERPGKVDSVAAELSDELYRLLAELKARTPLITTVSNGKPNRIVSVARGGVRIETGASLEKGSGPQLVPAWMINVAWNHLRSSGSLTAKYLLASSGLNVKRSSAVCALLSRLPGVTVASTRPIKLRYRGADQTGA